MLLLPRMIKFEYKSIYCHVLKNHTHHFRTYSFREMEDNNINYVRLLKSLVEQHIDFGFKSVGDYIFVLNIWLNDTLIYTKPTGYTLDWEKIKLIKVLCE